MFFSHASDVPLWMAVLVAIPLWSRLKYLQQPTKTHQYNEVCFDLKESHKVSPVLGNAG